MVSSCEDGQLWHRSVNACLAPLYSVEGMHVVTVEGMRPALLWSHPRACFSWDKSQPHVKQGVAGDLKLERSR